MKHKRLAWVVGLVALGAGAHFLSKPPPPEPTPPGMVDYGPEFAKWRALGLPDTLGGEPVYVFTGGFRCGTGMSAVDRVLVDFRWSRPSGKRGVVEVVNETGVQEFTPTFGWPAWMAYRASDWFKVQLPRRPLEPADVVGLFQTLLGIAGRDQKWNFNWDYYCAEMMIFAAQAHRAGHEGDANRLMDQLTRSSANAIANFDPTRLLHEVVRNTILSRRISDLQTAAAKDWNWQALAEGYRSLQADLDCMGYGSLKDDVPLKEVLPRIEGQPATISGPGVPPEAALLADKLARAAPEQFDPAWFEGEYWLFRDWGPPREDEPPLVSLLRMGPEAIPLLMAMSKDEWPLPLSLPWHPWAADVFLWNTPGWELDTSFPLTRGKLAKLLLAQLANPMYELPDKPDTDDRKVYGMADTSPLDNWKNWASLPREDRIRHFRSSRFLLMSYLAWNSPLPGETLPPNPKKPWLDYRAQLDPTPVQIQGEEESAQSEQGSR